MRELQAKPPLSPCPGTAVAPGSFRNVSDDTGRKEMTMTSKRSHAIWMLAGLLVASTPAWAQRGTYERDGAFRLHLGAFQPEGDSEYWDDKFEDFTGDIDEMEKIGRASCRERV